MIWNRSTNRLKNLFFLYFAWLLSDNFRHFVSFGKISSLTLHHCAIASVFLIPWLENMGNNACFFSSVVQFDSRMPPKTNSIDNSEIMLLLTGMILNCGFYLPLNKLHPFVKCVRNIAIFMNVFLYLLWLMSWVLFWFFMGTYLGYQKSVDALYIFYLSHHFAVLCFVQT